MDIPGHRPDPLDQVPLMHHSHGEELQETEEPRRRVNVLVPLILLLIVVGIGAALLG